MPSNPISSIVRPFFLFLHNIEAGMYRSSRTLAEGGDSNISQSVSRSIIILGVRVNYETFYKCKQRNENWSHRVENHDRVNTMMSVSSAGALCHVRSLRAYLSVLLTNKARKYTIHVFFSLHRCSMVCFLNCFWNFQECIKRYLHHGKEEIIYRQKE